MSEIKTLEQYVLAQLESRNAQIAQLQIGREHLESTIERQSEDLRLLKEIGKFVRNHVTIVTRGKYDGESTIERIDMGNVPHQIYEFSRGDEIDMFLRIRDVLIKLGAKVEEGHTLVTPRKKE